MDIENISAIVTGGASGMGATTAKMLAKKGAKVTIFDLNMDLANKIAEEIKGFAVQVDVTQEDSVTDAIKNLEKKFGPARICINCAGIAPSKRMVGKDGPHPLDEFQKTLEINLLGTFNVMRLAAAHMIPLDVTNEDNERGVIINTASVAAYEGQIGQIAYSASKGGVVGMTLPAARELAQFGIRVVTIAPGLIETPLFEKLPEAARASLAQSVPFPKRLGYASEFAKLACHIVGNCLINGCVIRLDGALRMAPK